ncbi:MAG: hypothetical protein NVSMB3_14100 [Acidobacteriaceae bacterium]
MPDFPTTPAVGIAAATALLCTPGRPAIATTAIAAIALPTVITRIRNYPLRISNEETPQLNANR